MTKILNPVLGVRARRIIHVIGAVAVLVSAFTSKVEGGTPIGVALVELVLAGGVISPMGGR